MPLGPGDNGGAALALQYQSSGVKSKHQRLCLAKFGRAAVEEDNAAGQYRDSWPKSMGLEHIIPQAKTKSHDC
jgi:hypothetical protein